MKLISRLSFMLLGVLTMALMMMSGSSSKAQTASPSDTKIMTFTVGDYQEFKKANALARIFHTE